MHQEFEQWYSLQKRNQQAIWHPVETLDDQDKIFYPNGRYTILSSKQAAWETWQAAWQAASA